MAGSGELTWLLDRIAADTYTQQDVQRLRDLVIRGDRNEVQVGRYNVRLDQARNIHIGDRIYRGVEADAIRGVLTDVMSDLGYGNLGRGSLRGLSGFIMTVGIVIALVGMGMFFYGILSAMQEADPATVESGPPDVLIQGFAIAFGGIVVAGIGQLVRGWERPRHGR